MGEAVCFELYEVERGYPDLRVAVVEGPREQAEREIQHYAMIYAQDGPVEIREREGNTMIKLLAAAALEAGIPVTRADLEAMLAHIVATEGSAEAKDMPERWRLKTLLRRYLRKDQPNGPEAVARIKALEAMCEKLAGAVETYGRHKRGCSIFPRGTRHLAQCSCGLSQALAAYSASKDKPND